jgi:hypothetical protein
VHQIGDVSHAIGERAVTVLGNEPIDEHADLGTSAQSCQRFNLERGGLWAKDTAGVPVLILA